ncbi:ComF family protein [Roseivirga sp. E12]|uniref:ComF family protein n=1 Tax=Roseivirga sp. E12 TaxID=2819237 RepID=UPI001ABC2301|nr:ComF family protein [Roseivirga sp. E12]
MKGSFSTYLSDFVSLFYPNLCLGCDELLPKGSEYLCPKCHYNLPKTHTHRLEVPQFKEKFEGVVAVRDVLVYAHFFKKGLIQKVLHQLKYGNQPGIGEMIGRRYGKELLESGYADAYDLIVPVPLHEKRFKERGYNQSEHFGLGLSKALGIPMNVDSLVKVKHVGSQTKRSKLSRIVNVDGVFKVLDNSFYEKRVLLVDDLMTTGSTLVACLEVLRECKPEFMGIATIGGAK